MKHRIKFEEVTKFLREWQQQTEEELRETHGAEETLTRKRQIDRAIACLELCQTYQIHPDSEVIVLPWPVEHFGGFDVVEVDECDHVTKGGPVRVNGNEVRLTAGDLVIRLGHCFNLPPDEKAVS
jgi:hypothetical protein